MPKETSCQVKKLDNLIWMNIINPDTLSLKKLLIENSMNESLSDEIIDPTSSAKVDYLRNAIYLTLHLPIKRGEIMLCEKVIFLIKSNLIISSQKQEITSIKEFVENLKSTELHGGIYFVNFLKDMYKNLNLFLDKTSSDQQLLEKNIFNQNQKKSIRELSEINKKLLDFKNSFNSHSETLKNYNEGAIKLFGYEYNVYCDIITQLCARTSENLENQLQKNNSLKDTADLLLKNKNNQLLKVTTVITFLALPLIFIASFFSMNTKIPNDIFNSPYQTVYIMITMFFVSTIMLLYLHFKKII